MGNLYNVLKDKRQQEVNAFPMFFAFSNKQFEEGMVKFGLSPEETDKVVSVSVGTYMLKKDVESFKEMLHRHETEMKEAMEDKETGVQFIFDMFNYELANHEYGYTGETEDTINALGLTFEEIQKDPRLAEGLEKACAYQRENAE